jgi:hypothetical protein
MWRVVCHSPNNKRLFFVMEMLYFLWVGTVFLCVANDIAEMCRSSFPFLPVCVTSAEPPGGFPVNLCWRVVLQAFRYVPVTGKAGHHWRALVNLAQLLTYLSDGKLSANIHSNSNFTSSPNIVRVIKRIRWAGNVARMGERKGVYRVLVGKPEFKWPLGRPRNRWEDNKIHLQEVGCGGFGLDRAGSGQGQVAYSCECGKGPSGSIKCGEFLD